MTAKDIERCYLCGTELPEAGSCRNPMCRASWGAYERPIREEQAERHKPVARRDEVEEEA